MSMGETIPSSMLMRFGVSFDGVGAQQISDPLAVTHKWTSNISCTSQKDSKDSHALSFMLSAVACLKIAGVQGLHVLLVVLPAAKHACNTRLRVSRGEGVAARTC